MSKDRDYPLGTVCSEQCDDCRTSGTSAEYIYDPMTGAPIESVCQCTVMDIIQHRILILLYDAYSIILLYHGKDGSCEFSSRYIKSCIPALCLDTDISWFAKHLEDGYTHPDATSKGLHPEAGF